MRERKKSIKMKSFLVAVTFALVAGLGVLALKEGKKSVLELEIRDSYGNMVRMVASCPRG